MTAEDLATDATDATNVTVARVDPALTHPLRQRVLRPGKPVAAAVFGADGDPEAAAFAARTAAAGTVVGTALVHPAACPWRPGPTAWRLRAMATAPEARSRGIGARVMAAALAYAAEHGAEVVWCHARAPARRFYERAGFVAHGEEWEEGDIGPHVAMSLDIADSPTP